MVNGFTPTEKRILALLSDGAPHRREEVHKCLDDDLAQLSAIRPHISRIKPKLKPQGEDVVCVVFNGSYHYQHVRLISSAYDGRV